MGSDRTSPVFFSESWNKGVFCLCCVHVNQAELARVLGPEVNKPVVGVYHVSPAAYSGQPPSRNITHIYSASSHHPAASFMLYNLVENSLPECYETYYLQQTLTFCVKEEEKNLGDLREQLQL